MTDYYSNFIGIVGVSLVLLAYFLLQTNTISNKEIGFSLLNLLGAILILYSLLYHWNLASVIIEIAWIIISIQGLITYYINSRSKTTST